MQKFSPDGKSIAYNANYDGTNDIYLLPVTGGIPKNHLTWDERQYYRLVSKW
ncbi:MAG: hypothetical protein R2771_13405 [Saprospiraceae bacterium]